MHISLPMRLTRVLRSYIYEWVAMTSGGGKNCSLYRYSLTRLLTISKVKRGWFTFALRSMQERFRTRIRARRGLLECRKQMLYFGSCFFFLLIWVCVGVCVCRVSSCWFDSRPTRQPLTRRYKDGISDDGARAAARHNPVALGGWELALITRLRRLSFYLRALFWFLMFMYTDTCLSLLFFYTFV